MRLVGNLELPDDPLHVDAHRIGRDGEDGGNVVHRLAARRPYEAFAFAGAQPAVRTGPKAHPAEQVIVERRLEIVRDTGALDAAIATAMAAKPDAVRDFRSGKQNALGPLIGAIMKQVAGADPKQVRERLIAAMESGQ